MRLGLSLSLAFISLSLGVTAQNVTHGAIAMEIAECSQIGGDILRIGGNAADAMIAGCLCVGTVASYHSGIGGGGFMLVRSAEGTYETIDFREKAPLLSNETMYVQNINLSLVGGLAVGVPGELAGFWALHQKYGKLPWSILFQPAINLAANGFKVPYTLAKTMHMPGYDFLVNDPTFAAVFAPNGTLLNEGDTMFRPTYAQTLDTIATYGIGAFYNGPIASSTIREIQRTGGIMTLGDLQNYSVEIREPVNITYRGFTLHSCPAPSSGTIALSALNILSGYDMSNATNLNISTHRLVEAIKFAYGQRGELADPAFILNVTTLEGLFLEPSTGDVIRGLIRDNETFQPAAYDPINYLSIISDGAFPSMDAGTSHMVTADDTGLVVSLTTTVNLYWGAQLMVPETGIVLNDEMNDFSSPGSSNAFGYVASPGNYPQPGKRPQSSISPTIVDFPNGTFFFAVGAAGGSRITTSTIQNLWHVLDQGLDAYDALAEPRLHDQIIPQTTTFEYAYSNATTAYLASIGHNVSWVAPGLSIAQAVMERNGMFQAATDPRRIDSGGSIV